MPLSLPILLIAGLTALVGLAIFLVVRDIFDRRRAERAQRWQDTDDDGGPSLADKLAASRPPEDWRGRIDWSFGQMLVRSGLGLNVDQAVALLSLIAVVLAGGALLWQDDFWVAGICVAIGLSIPLVILRIMQGRWRKRVQEQLPDAFFLLARSLRAGLSLEQSLSTVGEHGAQPIAGEFARAAGHIRLGLSGPAALQVMANRLQLADVHGLVSIVGLHRTTGGNLPFLLDRWGQSTRDRNQFRGYFQSATALGRITAIALVTAAPLLFVGYWIWHPEYMRNFIVSQTGMLALGTALLLEIVGTAWVYLLNRVQY